MDYFNSIVGTKIRQNLNIDAFRIPAFREISISGREIDLNSGSLPPIPEGLATLATSQALSRPIQSIMYNFNWRQRRTPLSQAK